MKNINKNMMLPVSFAVDVYRLIFKLDKYILDGDTCAIIKQLEDALTAKVEAMERRETYTEYKMAATDDTRERARQKYLDLAGIHPDWRWGADAELRRRAM